MTINKRLFFQFLFVVLLVSVLAFMIYILFWMQSEQALCVRNPVGYYANKTEISCQEGSVLHISCQFDPNFPLSNFDLNFSPLSEFLLHKMEYLSLDVS